MNGDDAGRSPSDIWLVRDGDEYSIRQGDRLINSGKRPQDRALYRRVYRQMLDHGMEPEGDGRVIRFYRP